MANVVRWAWRENLSLRFDAQVVGEELTRIARSLGRKVDGLTAEDVINASREPGTVLHEAFEWDNDVAGESYRLEQARRLIRGIGFEVVHDGIREVRIGRVNVTVSGERVYVFTPRAVREVELRRQMLDDATKGLEAWRARNIDLAGQANDKATLAAFKYVDEALRQFKLAAARKAKKAEQPAAAAGV
jgi:hypothetical protein